MSDYTKKRHIAHKSRFNSNGQFIRLRAFANKHYGHHTKEVLAMAIVRLQEDYLRYRNHYWDDVGRWREQRLENDKLKDIITAIKTERQEYKTQLSEARALTNFKNEHILILQSEKMLKLKTDVELGIEHIIEYVKPKPTLRERLKAMFNTPWFTSSSVKMVKLPKTIPPRPRPDLVTFESPEDWEADLGVDDI